MVVPDCADKPAVRGAYPSPDALTWLYTPAHAEGGAADLATDLNILLDER